MSKPKSVRLPSHIKPQRYRILMRPEFKDFTFSGEETIYLDILKPVKEITLHSVDLEIYEVHVGGIAPIKILFDAKSETITFIFPKTIPKSKAELSLKFKGHLTDKLKGFYRSRYHDGGKEKFLATTQFEATDARRAFPCFDEPAQKAIFDVTLEVPKTMTAVSNTVETSIAEHESGYKTVRFAPSPKMSTYLLAFIVGELEFIEAKSKRGVVVRVFTTKGKKQQGRFALDVATRSLDFYEDYFGILYPLPILDLIAVPDFASGAMENWGAITYRETALLYDEKHSSAANKQWVAIVIAHEIAHQWFGNLVTMEWWTDLWLNEGFASYMEYLCVDALFPEWQMWDQYVADRFTLALRTDSLKTTHPIEVEVHSPDEINEAFDVPISYGKSAAIIRMLAEFLGQKVFRKGLTDYMKKHAYKNAITEDLWMAFEKASGKPVRKIMSNWTKLGGYPVVDAQLKNSQLKLSQKRFLSSEVTARQLNDKTLWQVPLNILSARGHSKLLLTKKSQTVPLKSDWLKLNAGEVGFYRTKYPQVIIDKLKPAIASKEFSTRDRLGIIRDCFALAESGDFTIVEALKLAEFYKEETELPVWEELAIGINAAGKFYEDESWYSLYQKYYRELLQPLVNRLGWDKSKKDSHSTVMLRSLVLLEMGRAGDKGTLEKAKKMFSKGAVEADLRGVVYNLAAQDGGQTEFNKMVEMYRASAKHHEEQDRIGRAMSSFKDPKILKQVLDFALSKDVRAQDAPSIFIGVGRNFYGRYLAWQYLKKNWQTIERRYKVGGHLLEWFVAPFSSFTTQAAAKDYERFFKLHPVPALNRTIQQVLERIYSNVAWIKRDKKNIEKWLKSR